MNTRRRHSLLCASPTGDNWENNLLETVRQGQVAHTPDLPLIRSSPEAVAGSRLLRFESREKAHSLSQSIVGLTGRHDREFTSTCRRNIGAL
ncbi:hypothetical protein PoB_007029300 [Plakobranchus ocellatus]|uniref:Uncharacterized protein n=1 Tax=Plakobranchus ocellatus TaxID=259542 RepID=A0AAV4DHM8_9GAST|nr:hypothetical protein PoB_007029300 [Plakobranchus ocellatus]